MNNGDGMHAALEKATSCWVYPHTKDLGKFVVDSAHLPNIYSTCLQAHSLVYRWFVTPRETDLEAEGGRIVARMKRRREWCVFCFPLSAPKAAGRQRQFEAIRDRSWNYQAQGIGVAGVRGGDFRWRGRDTEKKCRATASVSPMCAPSSRKYCKLDMESRNDFLTVNFSTISCSSFSLVSVMYVWVTVPMYSLGEFGICQAIENNSATMLKGVEIGSDCQAPNICRIVQGQNTCKVVEI